MSGKARSSPPTRSFHGPMPRTGSGTPVMCTMQSGANAASAAETVVRQVYHVHRIPAIQPFDPHALMLHHCLDRHHPPPRRGAASRRVATVLAPTGPVKTAVVPGGLTHRIRNPSRYAARLGV